MNINFSEVFKKLRRERELTQEQAAEAFSVSTQAVSRWENGQTSPDITLLPIIAEYFGVSIETLLGVDSEKRREKHEQYMNDFEAAIKSGRVNDCIEIARTGLKEFPHSYELMNALMYALFLTGSKEMKDWEENIEKYKQEIIDLGERILNGCHDDDIRLEVKARLGYHYCEIGEIEKGRKIIMTLPTENFTRDEYLRHTMRGKELLDYTGKGIAYYAEVIKAYICRLIDNDPELQNDPEAILMHISATKQIDDALFLPDDKGQAFIDMAKRWLKYSVPALIKLGNTDKAVDVCEKAAEYIEKWHALPDEYYHTSPITRGTISARYWETVDPRPMEQRIYEDMLCGENCKALSGNERFEKIKERIKALF
ncbi:MAG: helix-turn-helix transcriptional regulator [Ruminococcus sp.]|nr:helix-turn-helix transcriptional regulator [Ruminococcus sp.]